jgi:hypothetical protein
MASKTAKPRTPKSGKSTSTRGRRTSSKATSGAATAPRTSTIPRAGLDVIDATESDPGMPDPIDVAETARPLSPEAAKSIALGGGDLDASFSGIDSGEEAVGGSDPLPEQNDVDRLGYALGVEEQDEKPLATTEKIEGRDRERWELDPASSEDYEERQRAEAPRRRRQQ